LVDSRPQGGDNPCCPGQHEGVALIWSLFGVIIALLSGLFALFGIYRRFDQVNARIDALGGRLDSRIDALSADLRMHSH
jgi:hypothetical protein